MFRNYFAAALRNLLRNRAVSLVNIAGLGIAFAAALLIALYVRYERSYEHFIPGHERIYRISESWRQTDGAFERRETTSQKVANLRRDPRIAACQVDRARWATLEGTAEVRTDAASVAEAVERYAARYRQPRENPDRVALRITIEKVIGNV